jgi:hypothetical protein
LQPLRGRTFGSREQLAEAMQQRIGPQNLRALQPRLLASAETVPAQVRVEGLARVRLFNPLPRPLLLRVRLDVWFGQFPEPPPAVWVYLAPSQSQSLDLPAGLLGSLERSSVRLDLRLSEVNGPFLPGYHKLYVPLQP